ncbi:hypothetical protein RHSIM_Rhsim01G0043700 [Rhododendron simsii]|uniref:Lipocalin/cytosolic fatty-acid binding domain-containing protein n=1 Tax=Rhododendron simsii TaxID=118357 RepID=A0A834LXG5_RHOSS|nr:hypothetical protein RHSIM_Rhsim01G0043700 [Rhododendron simsii]
MANKEMEVVKGLDLNRYMGRWDYQYALIGQPSKKYLWIPCIENHLDEEIYNQLVQKAKEEGFDVSKLHKTEHTNPPPEGEEGPKNTKGILVD